MINFFKEYIRKNALKEKQSRRTPIFLNIKEIHSVGFVYSLLSAESFDELARIIAFLEKKGISWQGIGVEAKKGLLKKMNVASDGNLEMKGITFIEKERVNWVGIPENTILEKLSKNKFDLFICLNNADNFTLDYIAYEINARLVVGMKNTRYSVCPFVLESREGVSSDFDGYLEQLFHYLSIIKQNTHL